MTTTERRLAPPERAGGQGLDPNQEESGNRAIIALLTDDSHGPTDWLATYRHDSDGPDGQVAGAYEVWSLRGMIRFQRFLDADGGYGYEVIEQSGENPIANQDPTAVATIAEEVEASAKSGFDSSDPNRAFMSPEALSYPLAFERIAQLFDSPNAPDIVVNPRSYAYGRQPGQHGSADVVQSRAPLVFSGPGIKRTGTTDALCAQVDIAPTLARLLGLPLIDGMDSTGRTSSERGVEPDVYLRRQDGRPIDEIIDDPDGQDGARPERAYIFLLDGLSNTELMERLENDRESIPNLARLIERGLMFNYGTTVNFPSITWPSHNTLGSGAWCGHHDVINPAYYVRETRETVTPQGQVWDTAKFVTGDVETLFEAVHRVHGKWDGHEGVITASINEPCVRGAAHATLERRLLIEEEKLREMTRVNRDDTNPRWKEEGQESVQRYSFGDIQGTVQSMLLFGADGQPPPMFTFHAYALPDAVGHDYGPHSGAIRDALIETDKRIGKVLDVIDARGLFESTLFVITTDHGMAPIDTDLSANQVQAVLDAGLRAVVHAPLVYLLDMDVMIEHAKDGRTATITVVENDPTESGFEERPPVSGAKLEVTGHKGKVVSRATADDFGVCGVPLPVDEDPEHLVIGIHHDKFNERHLRLDGTNVVEDVRKRLYG